MPDYIVALFVILVLSWFLLRILVPLINKDLSVTSLIAFFNMRKFGFPVFYFFLVPIAFIQYKSGMQFTSLKDFLITSLLAFPLLLIFTYGLSGLVLHWMLNDVLAKAFSNGKTIDRIEEIGIMQKSIWRWRFLHHHLFRVRGLYIQDVFAAFGIAHSLPKNP